MSAETPTDLHDEYGARAAYRAVSPPAHFGPAFDAELFREDESLAELVAELERTPRPARVLSFDFFDTLVARFSPEPADAFIEVGRRLSAAGLLACDVEPEAFRQVRQTAEARAREAARSAGRSVEVSLADIYAALAKVVTDPLAAAGVEYETEQDFCWLNPCTTALLRHAHALGYEISILSDTYFTADQLRGILCANGFDPSLVKLVLTSCETGVWKGSGALFRVAHRALGIHPLEMIHIGDNAAADVRGAAEAGTRGHHYYRTTPYIEEVLKRERRVVASSHVASSGFDSLRVLAQRLLAPSSTPAPSTGAGASGTTTPPAPLVDENERALLAAHEKDGAFLLGPMLARFSDWCVGEFQRTGVRRVLALMREGELLGDMLERSAAAAGLPLTVVRCFVSRQATALASVGEATPDSLKPVTTSPLEYTVGDFFFRLGLSKEKIALSHEQLSQVVDSPELLRTLMRFASQGELRGLVEDASTRARKAVFAYLEPLLGDDEKIGVIDLGWAGTIQKNLARICELSGRKVDFVGRYLLTNARACDRLLEGTDVRSMLGNMGAKSSLCRAIWVSPQLLEESVNACQGSTVGYTLRDDGGADPILGPSRMTAEEKRRREAVQAGMRRFQSVWLSVRAQKARSPRGETWTRARLQELDLGALATLHRVVASPTHGEATRFGGLHREENFFSDHWVPMVNDAAREALREGGIAGLVESRESCWPQGVVATEAAGISQALASGWDDGNAIARFCATPRQGGQATSASADEAACVESLLRTARPDRVVFIGFDGKGDDAWFAKLGETARARGEPFAALHVARELGEKGAIYGRPAGAAAVATHGAIHVAAHDASSTGANEDTERSDAFISAGGVRIAGDVASDAVLRQVRRHLRPTQRNLVVLDRTLSESAVRRALAQLAPFVGPHATIAVGHGGREIFSLLHEGGPFRAVRLWLHESGMRLGFAAAEHGPGHERELFTVLARKGASAALTGGADGGVMA